MAVSQTISGPSYQDTVALSSCILTPIKLRNIDPHTTEANRNQHLEGLNQAFSTFEINNCLRKAHFLAQILHESGHLALTRESGSQAYLQEKPYFPYIGRGLMQLTWQSNYVNYSNSVAEDCHSTSTNREKLERPPHAAKSAGHFWTNIKHLNDEADINDFLKITYLINGGFNGFKERLEILRNAFLVFNLSESSNYIFNQSWIYNNYKASLGWAMWHDVGSNKFLSASCDASVAIAREGYERCIILTANEIFPKYDSNGHIIKYYGHTNPRQYAQNRLAAI